MILSIDGEKQVSGKLLRALVWRKGKITGKEGFL